MAERGGDAANGRQNGQGQEQTLDHRTFLLRAFARMVVLDVY